MKWISTNERLPEKEGDYRVKIFVGCMNAKVIEDVKHYTPFNYYSGSWAGCFDWKIVTHWAYPTPPEGE